MYTLDDEKTREFQEFIDYEFNNLELLIQALTTPSLGKEIGKPHYEFLETLGDAVIKIIFILKLYKKGIKEPGDITKIKASLESDKALGRIANKIQLEKYIFKTKKQRIKGTRILADIFEAICGALFLDSDCNINLVQQKLIDPFYQNLENIVQNSIISSKNLLLEFLQEKYKTSVIIELDYEKNGEEHDPIWVAKNPKILDRNTQRELIKLPIKLKSNKFRNKKEVEKDIYAKILKYLINYEKYKE